MVRLDHNQPILKKSFCLSEQDEEGIRHITTILDTNNVEHITKCIERVWVDEQISDNAKAYLVFTLGRCYQEIKHRGG